MHSAVDIANIFVSKGLEEDSPVTQMQLQKMVYFAHGITLAYTEGKNKLVKEKFEAWDFGPVIPEIYHEFKQFGAKPITPEVDIYRLINKGRKFESIELENPTEKKIVDDTWEALKGLTGIQLSKWTHKDDSAWAKVYRRGSRSIKLKDEDIINDFTPLLTKSKESKQKVGS
ncbi:MAG: hypothetical protein COA32_09680 [Fluviicola sp.]|nr:MAG: hypothetical protein COA32_09680 [Fluviicola sp.]